MAGFHNNAQNDSCYIAFQEKVNESVVDRQLNVAAVMRSSGKCNAAGNAPCDFYAPLRGRKVTQESYMQGRGQILSDCPDGDAIALPAALFPSHPKLQPNQQYDVSMQPTNTRWPKSCNSVSESNMSVFRGMPGAYQRGYQGAASLAGTHLDSRLGLGAIVPPKNECHRSYGTYGSGRSFAQYAA